ncbi:MAG: hypothetical protein ACD_16C00099G0010 [uncultured bacterium]|nr:MAG: hypothetical protein ACD_16C00099G0010 [uncultured bacterium]OFW68149.1 MAG: hypothetical protein A2X70_05570 [Alphaproteobacteria bacterium GWC2_42_16]OFW73542.1 MAG: hypothetical protein A2Z80_06870 [Alphaproteobacteria bacterium GWA2_41_27]OFW82391.1 MAG: hypothetical protein A3E50_04270 [Alphaproteobacteria bacterium RIFCSPHIGHO2_12_FULL_42_100]OFW86217.1 MAG: hypothetical protein A2W06_01200 [Alphaproteobacteria bacterium RBG_16_42_14]OFW91775.1 MAG: hypothetical protein A3C41_012
MKRLVPFLLSACFHFCLIGALSFVTWQSVPQEIQTYKVLWVDNKKKTKTIRKPLGQKRMTHSPRLIREYASASQDVIASEIKDQKVLLRKAYKPLPSYPWICRKRGHEGVVAIFIRTNDEGKVIESKIKKSSGYDLLDEAALKAILHWVLAEGRVQKTFSIVFRLNG